MMTLGWTLCFLGVVVLLIAALGLLRLPDALARQHAATKAGTLGLGLLILGAGLAAGRWDWTPRLLLLLALLMVSLPLASHALARAAARSGPEPTTDETGTPPRGK